MNTVRLI